MLCLVLIGLVLLQQGKGADMGAAFGGGNNTVFGATGGADFITKVTTWSAILFMVTSILLVRSYASGGFEPDSLATQPSGQSPLAGSVMDGQEQKAKTAADDAAAPPVSSAPLKNKISSASAAKAADAKEAAPAADSGQAPSAAAKAKDAAKK